ncbi:MAG: hypothetical protein US62_C0045G0011 [Candidatus Woesebacteria bacterium GW2011_GWA1_37_8]|uniref:Peptide zinc metalloprotease protein n=1 Tax=Candidatus Woesebacteria bacterium GW2011_GWA1_37_8 TaxID=1618546 RepID=A0A0G0K3J2_9BACT|nr:MAG: hypothetical protein US62_C0045G0011 [Candidatus Woesebacteria bacterium GW2011_GWA1_37_8]
MELNSSDTIGFHDIRYSTTPNTDGSYNMVRWDTDENINVNESALSIIKSFADKKTIRETAEHLNISIEDVKGFLKFLNTLGYIKSVGEKKVKDNSVRIHPWFSRYSKAKFSWLISRPVLLVSFIYSITGILLGVTVLQHVPTYKDFFWTDDLFIISIVGAIVGWALIFNHELAHFIFAKAVGADSIVRYSNRYLYLAVITEHYHLAVLDKPFRYLVYLAGMYVDVFLIATIYFVFVISKLVGIDLDLVGSFLNSVVILLIVGIVGEFNMFLETDLYNFFTDYLNQDNLYNDTKRYLINVANKWNKPLLMPIKKLLKKVMFSQNLLVRTNNPSTITKSDRNVIHFFSYYYIAGIFMATILVISITLPRDFKFIVDSLEIYTTSVSSRDVIGILKSFIIILLAIFPNILLIDAIIKKQKKYGTFM